MADLHLHDSESRGNATPDLSDDLRALRDETAREPRTLAQHVASIRSRRESAAPARRTGFMTMKDAKNRPWLASAMAALLLVIALLVIPVSYLHTTGTQVSLRLSGVNDTQLGAVAQQLKSQLHSGAVEVHATMENDAPAFEIETVVPAG